MTTINELTGTTGKVGNEDINWVDSTGVPTFTVPTYSGAATITLNKVPRVPWYDVRSYTSINAAITTIGATVCTLVVPDAQTLTANLVIPATMSLFIPKGGSIVKASTYTLTVNGPLNVGHYQGFSGFTYGADLTLANSLIIDPAWYGVAGGITIYGGIASGESLTLSSTYHATKGYIKIPDKVEINSSAGWVLSDSIFYIYQDAGAPTDIQPAAFFATVSKGGVQALPAKGSSALEVHAHDRADVTALNKGFLAGIQIFIELKADRGNVLYDDVNALTCQGISNFKGTDCVYIGHFADWVPATYEWYHALSIDAWADTGIGLYGKYDYGFDMNATLALVGGRKYAIIIPSSSGIYARNVTDTLLQPLIGISGADHVQVGMDLPAGKLLVLGEGCIDLNPVVIHVNGADKVIHSILHDGDLSGHRILVVDE